ncbi:HAD hydrolase family protein [Paenibacillus alkaliterrae]|uniref:HAD hydrolase family protein n=1 Tax=Paenibacillus alkaliterrae TaxID=320909 RepID=UPI0038B264F3
MNGALVCDIKTGIEEHTSIPKGITIEILEYCVEYLPQCKISIEAKDKWFSNQEISDSSIYNPKFSPHVLKIDQLKEIEATKMLLSDFEEHEKLRMLFRERIKFIITDNCQQKIKY